MANKLVDYGCLKIASIVGTGIHLYSFAINNQHFSQIVQDFSEGNYIRGSLKAIVPFALPYGVSYYSKKKAQRETKAKIASLENKIAQLESQEKN